MQKCSYMAVTFYEGPQLYIACEYSFLHPAKGKKRNSVTFSTYKIETFDRHLYAKTSLILLIKLKHSNGYVGIPNAWGGKKENIIPSNNQLAFIPCRQIYFPVGICCWG
jgi:hypothetical protein